MKTYEEMARDVLKRRDEELKKLELSQPASLNSTQPEIFYPTKNKKRRMLSAIAVPCAAAVLISGAAVTLRSVGRWGNGALVEGSGDGPNAAGIADSGEESGLTIDQPLNNDGNSDGEKDKTNEKQPLSYFSQAGTIGFLDDVPEFLLDHGFFKSVNPAVFAVGDKEAEPEHPFEDIPFTVDELSEFYGIEFDRLSRYHRDWEEFYTSNFGIAVYTGSNDSLIESTETYNGKKIAYTISGIAYDIPDNEGHMSREVLVEAVKIGIGVDNMFNPFEHEDFNGHNSEINGHRAMVYHNRHLKDTYRLEAVIEMGDNTLVRISTNDISEYLFMDILWQFTSPNIGTDESWGYSGTDTWEYNGVNFSSGPPQYLIDAEHGFVSGKGINQPVMQVPFTIDELNSYFGVELDCLGKLHPEWKTYVSREYGMFVDDSEGAQGAITTDGKTVGGRKVVSSWNDLHYTLEYGELTVSAVRLGETPSMFSPFDSAYYPGGISPDLFTELNGYMVLAYGETLKPDIIDSAIIQMGDTLIKITAKGFGGSKFAEFIKEFTAQTGTAITPWAELSQDGFADYINS